MNLSQKNEWFKGESGFQACKLESCSHSYQQQKRLKGAEGGKVGEEALQLSSYNYSYEIHETYSLFVTEILKEKKEDWAEKAQFVAVEIFLPWYMMIL